MISDMLVYLRLFLKKKQTRTELQVCINAAKGAQLSMRWLERRKCLSLLGGQVDRQSDSLAKQLSRSKNARVSDAGCKTTSF